MVQVILSAGRKRVCVWCMVVMLGGVGVERVWVVGDRKIYLRVKNIIGVDSGRT